uniref:TPT domain-containing protein n=1 Tax=Parastrongyloides trichosuri TaxID=131310 RepID=A0A0N4ZN19_PARTI
MCINNTKENKKEKNIELKDYLLICPLAIFGSLSWLEFGNLEYDNLSLIFAPIHAISKGVYLLYAQNIFREVVKNEKNVNFNNFCFNISMMTSLLLVFPAIISASGSVVNADASWESIDYTLIGLSFIYMIGMKYSEFNLSLLLDLRHYVVLEHTKFFLASIGQWYIQNMAHATIYAFFGKIFYVISLIRYWIGLDKTENNDNNISKQQDVKQEKYF